MIENYITILENQVNEEYFKYKMEIEQNLKKINFNNIDCVFGLIEKQHLLLIEIKKQYNELKKNININSIKTKSKLNSNLNLKILNNENYNKNNKNKLLNNKTNDSNKILKRNISSSLIEIPKLFTNIINNERINNYNKNKIINHKSNYKDNLIKEKNLRKNNINNGRNKNNNNNNNKNNNCKLKRMSTISSFTNISQNNGSTSKKSKKINLYKFIKNSLSETKIPKRKKSMDKYTLSKIINNKIFALD